MIILIFFAFIAGIVTILSPCILPLLPIILSSSATGSKKYPFGVITGFIVSFTFFTLFLTLIVRSTGLSPDFLRFIAVAVIFIFGLVLVVPQLHSIFNRFAARLASRGAGIKKKENEQGEAGFYSGILIGVSLGLIWTPCVGPILASVITLAITGTVTSQAFVIILAYAIGTAIPMLVILYGGRQLIQSVPWLLRNLGNIQKIFGVLMIITAIAIYFNLDRKFQVYVLEKFPSYGSGLTVIEDNEIVRKQLEKADMPTTKESGSSDVNEVKTQTKDQAEEAKTKAPEIIPGGEWFNSEPLTIKSLRGKVILIDFWTYSCINCIRTLPYLRSWHEKYNDEGLVIIGVHTPEFEFEKDADNLQKAIDDFELKYPIVQDNEYKTWRAYNNHYWPAKYFIDHEGNIVSHHFGEGAYDESEELIQKMLRDAGKAVDEYIDNEEYQIFSRTPETYLGYARMKGFASPEDFGYDKKTVYSFPEKLGDNQIAFTGEWAFFDEKAEPSKGSQLRINFTSKNVFLVMAQSDGSVGSVKVYLDGDPITDFAGKDVENSIVQIEKSRLYELVSLDEPGSHLLELEFLDENTEAYAFTFG